MTAPRRRSAVAGAALVSVMVLAGCGGGHSRAATVPATTVPSPAPTTTVVTAAPNPADDAAQACRAFESFDLYVAGAGEDGPDAAGEVGGMIEAAQEAVGIGEHADRWEGLDHDLERLETFTRSHAWPTTPKAAATEQVRVVKAACAALHDLA